MPIWRCSSAKPSENIWAISHRCHSERIVIASAGPSAGRNAQSGIVSDIVFSGEKVSIFIDTAIGPMEVHQFSASTENGTSIAVGQPLVVTWDPVDTMVFRAPLMI